MATAPRFTYFPVLSASTPTPMPTLAILTHTAIPESTGTTLRTTTRLLLLSSATTTIAGFSPRAVSYTTIYITPAPSSSIVTDEPMLREPVYGDLTWSYIVLLCVPFIFLAFALYTNYRDRRRRVADQDIEMQSYKKYWFPWRELDPGEVSNEVSRSSARIAAAAPPSLDARGDAAPGLVIYPGRRPHQKEPGHAWHPHDGEPMPPITLYKSPPSWGRRHSWWEVVAYPSLRTPLIAERRRQATAADYYTYQIYRRTGSRRNAGPEESAEDLNAEEADNDSLAATTGRASPDNELENNINRTGNKISSPNPWATHIPSYYGNFPSPVSPVSTSSPTQGNGSDSKDEGKAQPQAQKQPRAQTPIRRQSDRRRNHFDFSEDEADGQPAEPQHSYYADPSTRAGKKPAKPAKP